MNKNKKQVLKRYLSKINEDKKTKPYTGRKINTGEKFKYYPGNKKNTRK